MKLFRHNMHLFENIHRHGWPFAMDALERHHTGGGVLLDDYVEDTFQYRNDTVHTTPWVGVFHHPVTIDSPLTEDRQYTVKNVFMRSKFQQSLPHLVGAVAMSQTLAEFLVHTLSCPVFLIKHPTEIHVKQWRDRTREYHSLSIFQAGYFLRNTQFINQIAECMLPTCGEWKRAHHFYKPYGFFDWHHARDARLKAAIRPGAEDKAGVVAVSHLDGNQYDQLLSECVVAMWLYGASANNVVVECFAHATPLLVNRTPETEFYLGKNYPCFVESPQQAANMILDGSYAAAHYHLAQQGVAELQVDAFANSINQFVSEIERNGDFSGNNP